MVDMSGSTAAGRNLTARAIRGGEAVDGGLMAPNPDAAFIAAWPDGYTFRVVVDEAGVLTADLIAHASFGEAGDDGTYSRASHAVRIPDDETDDLYKAIATIVQAHKDAATGDALEAAYLHRRLRQPG
jgi:hypothetical protein